MCSCIVINEVSNAIMKTGTGIMGGWMVLLFAMAWMGNIWYWIEDRTEVVYNPILKWIMVHRFKYTVTNDKINMYSIPEAREVSCGVEAVFIVIWWIILLDVFALFMYNMPFITSSVVATIGAIYLTRYIRRVMRKVNKIEIKTEKRKR